MYQKVTLIGRLGQDPSYEKENHPVSFSLATWENIRDEEEESGWRTITTWHNVISWGSPEFRASLVERLEKGNWVLVEGKLRVDTYEDEDGNTRYSNKVEARLVKPLPMGRSSEPSEGGRDSGDSRKKTSKRRSRTPFGR